MQRAVRSSALPSSQLVVIQIAGTRPSAFARARDAAASGLEAGSSPRPRCAVDLDSTKIIMRCEVPCVTRVRVQISPYRRGSTHPRSGQFQFPVLQSPWCDPPVIAPVWMLQVVLIDAEPPALVPVIPVGGPVPERPVNQIMHELLALVGGQIGLEPGKSREKGLFEFEHNPVRLNAW